MFMNQQTINRLSITSILFQDFRVQIQNLFFMLFLLYDRLSFVHCLCAPSPHCPHSCRIARRWFTADCDANMFCHSANGSLHSAPPTKDPAAVVIAVERQRHQTKQTISRNGVFAELKECSVYPAEIQEVDGNLAAWVCEEALWNHGRLL